MLAALSTLGGVHIAQQTVAKIEKGARPLRYTEAVRIAEALSVDIKDFSAGHDQAIHAATQLQRLEDIRRTGEQLDATAEHLAHQLVQLADSTRERPEAQGEGEGWLIDMLEKQWAHVLDERPWYAEVLKRVSESAKTKTVLDESEA